MSCGEDTHKTDSSSYQKNRYLLQSKLPKHSNWPKLIRGCQLGIYHYTTDSQIPEHMFQGRWTTVCTPSLTQMSISHLSVSKGSSTHAMVSVHSSQEVHSDGLNLKGTPGITLECCPNERGDSPTTLPATPRQTNSNRKLCQGSFYTLGQGQLWWFQSVSTDKRQLMESRL